MNWKKINVIKTKNTETKIFLAVVFLVLIILALFSAANLITVIELRHQVNLILSDVSNTKTKTNQTVATSSTFYSLPSSDNIATTTSETSTPADANPNIEQEKAVSAIETQTEKPAYSNTFSEPFFNAYFVDTANTDMVLDEAITAMTFKPLYELKYEKNCSDNSCGLEKTTEDISSKIKIPAELAGKTIKNTSYNKLENNWIVGFVVSEGNQEMGYAYLYDGNSLKPLITNSTNQRMMTKYGYGGGSISAGGSDNQFIIFYSGYEGIAYLYNNGTWQDLSQYFGLRVTKNGFDAKIIKGGNGNNAVWYVCAEDGKKSKLIKLWQNNTSLIQGAIDLSSVLNNQSSRCFYKSNREINIVSNSNLQVFKDKGFDNSHIYYYQSNNINSYTGKKVIKIYFLSTSVNASNNSYTFFVSADKKNWQTVSEKETILDNKNLETAYLKAKFSAGASEYSPWFGGLDNIFYVAQDR